MQRKMTVGSEIDSYCGKCKMVLNHHIVAMVDSQPRRVRCLTCQSEHNHRLPKTKTSRPRRKTTSKTTSSGHSKSGMLAKWNAFMTEWDETAAKKYSIYASFNVNDQVTHSTFGKGVVTEVCGPGKIITLFESGEKLLMQGRTRN